MILQQDMLFQQVGIHDEERSGWVRIFTDPQFLAHPQLPLFLSETLSHWFREHPQFRPRRVVPISQGGDTVELHAWYDLQAFPASSVGQAKVLRGTE